MIRAHILTILAAAGIAMPVVAAEQLGYLATTPDITAVIPPAPVKGDPRYAADRQVFRATRAALATERGRFATADVAWSVPDLMRDFSCAAGMPLSPKRTPATYRLLANADADTARANDAAKIHWKRLRPFLIDRGPVCESKEHLSHSYDYPSGHTTRGWTAGQILADLLPDRATRILTRARAYGESRIVCGAHNMSAVEAGRLGATVSMQQVRRNARYRADFAAAANEILALRGSFNEPVNASMCAVEQKALQPSVLENMVVQPHSEKGRRRPSRVTRQATGS